MSEKVNIIGVAGTNGSGKDTVMDLLAENYGFYAASATNMLRDELERRHQPTDRTNKAALSAEWRRQYGMSAIVDRGYEYYDAHRGEYSGVVVGSLRHPGEADKIHELGGKVVWIDADPELRYKRIRSGNRGRGIEDDKSFEEFLADEAREMHPIGDAATLNVAAVKELADVAIFNNGSREEFKSRVIETLSL